MADCIERLARDPAFAQRCGRAAQQKVSQHYTVRQEAPRIFKIIENELARANRAK
jgi:glycosyltransferase involved in cell wall biosynthesis